MSKLTVECFKSFAEIAAYEKTDSVFIEYLFKPSCDGFVNINGESYKVKRGVCIIDASKLSDNEIFPTLVLANEKIALPPMIKENGEFIPKNYDADFLRKLSLSELRLTKRIAELEEKVDELSKRVYHTTIF